MPNQRKAKKKVTSTFDQFEGQEVDRIQLTWWKPVKKNDFIIGVLLRQFTHPNGQSFVMKLDDDSELGLPSHVDLMAKLRNIKFGTVIAIQFNGKKENERTGREEFDYSIKKAPL